MCTRTNYYLAFCAQKNAFVMHNKKMATTNTFHPAKRNIRGAIRIPEKIL
jgi:hypothetical protein